MGQDKKNAAKVYRKGECLYKQGEPVGKIYFLQTGLVSMSVVSQTSRVETYQATAPQVVGIEALSGLQKYETGAVALNDSTVLELPADLILQALSTAAPAFKLVIQGLINKVSTIHAEMQTIRLQGDPAACPPALTAKLFATVFHVVSYQGAPKGEMLRIVWPSFRKYCQRVFGESPVRLEHLIYLLSTLGHAELEMVKSDTDPDGAEELGFVRFKDIAQLESFAEFFRKRLKAMGPESCMELQDSGLAVAEILQRAFNPGTIDLQSVLDTLRSELSPQVVLDRDLEIMIARGLPIEIVDTGTSKSLKFTSMDLQRYFKNFRILTRIIEWNKSGRAPGAPDPDASRKNPKESK